MTEQDAVATKVEELEQEKEQDKKRRIRANRGKDIRYNFGWFLIGVVLIAADWWIAQQEWEFPLYVLIPHPLARLYIVGAVLCVLGLVTVLWAWFRPRK